MAFLRLLVLSVFLIVTVSGCNKKAKVAAAVGSTPTDDLEPAVTYDVSGTVSSLVGTVVLQVNSANDLSVTTGSTTFSWVGVVEDGTDYEVSVKTNPTGQECTVTNGSGTMDGEAVTDVQLTCAYIPTTLSCDSGYSIDSSDPFEAANAMGICDGLTAASWKLPDGTVMASNPIVDVTTLPEYHLGHGVLSSFGSNVLPQQGAAMLGLSSGTARSSSQPGYLAPTGTGYEKGYEVAIASLSGAGLPSKGDQYHPDDPGNCQNISPVGNDGIALNVTLTVPSGANRFHFDYRFFGGDFHDYICTQYVDQVAALVTTTGLNQYNAVVTNSSNPMNINTSDIIFCTANGFYSCPGGLSELLGTGFESTGATDWMTSPEIPVTAGDTVNIQFMVWDSGDGAGDSTILFDNFRWYAN